MNIVATGLPATIEDYQIALNAVFAGGKAFGAALATGGKPKQQKPVAIHQVYLNGGWADRDESEMWAYSDADVWKTRVVYTRPPAREWVGLTDEDVTWLCSNAKSHDQTWEMFVRAIEAKLKEKNS